jgi:Tfp pilus assembly protein PilO
MTDRQRKNWLLLAAVGCVLLLVGDRMVLSPLVNSWKSRSARIVELHKKINTGQMLLDRRDTLLTRWDAVKKGALPTNPTAAENAVLGAVHSWAASTGLSVTSILPRWIEDDKTGPRIELRVSGTGDMAAVGRFLYEIESSPMPLRLESVAMRARDDDGRSLSLEARFSGLIELERGKKI